MNSMHRVLAGGRVRERSLLDTAGLGLVEVTVAMGLMGVVVAGVMGVINMQQKATQNSNQSTQTNMMIQHIASLLGDSARCADALKVNTGTARFPMGVTGLTPVVITNHSSNEGFRHFNRVVANGTGGSGQWLQIAQVGELSRGLRLHAIIVTPQGPYQSLGANRGIRQFEVTFEFRPDGTGPERSLGSQVFTRGIGLRVTTTNGGGAHPDDTAEDKRWRTIEQCSVFQDNGQAACEAMGYTWEQGSNPPCRAGAGVFVNDSASRTSVMNELTSADGTLNSGIGTDDNIFAGRNIRSNQDIIAERDMRAERNLSVGQNFSARSIASNNDTDGWAAFNASGAQNGYNHPHLQFFRSQGTFAARTSIGTGNSGIIGGVYGSAWHTAGTPGYRQTSLMRYITDGAWSADNFPTAIEFFAARPGWRNFNDYGIQGSDPTLSYGGTGAMPTLRITSRGNLEVSNEIHFGKHRLYTGIPDNSGVLDGGYIAVDGADIEIGSRDENLQHIAFYNREIPGNYHMNTSQGQLRVIGSKQAGYEKKPSVRLLTRDGPDYNVPAAMIERDNGQMFGPGMIVLRSGGALTTDVNDRLILDGEHLGVPAAGKVLMATDGQGRARWSDAPGTLQIYSGTGTHNGVINIGSYTIPQCHFQIAPRHLVAEWGKGIQMLEVYVRNDAGTPRVWCKYNVEEGGPVRDCDQTHATAWTAFCQ
jgi:type II secretory pathway pseudopilin PulG